MTDYGYTVEVPEGYDEAVIRSRLALKSEGFSIITEMHVGGLLGHDTGSARQYLIMSAWNAAAAERPVGADLKVAVHLPCNVVVHETGSSAVVAAMDPMDMLEGDTMVPEEVASAARDALARALTRITTALT
ncbi:MAG: DUF302 domain-containing protein [Actinomycetota bacterium]